jgi:hypothetical protein
MQEEELENTVVSGEEDLNTNTQENPEADQKPKGKSKEENFDGLQKKFNATNRELKELKAKLAEKEATPKADEDKVSLLEAQLNQLVRQQKESMVERELEKVNLNPKYSTAAKALLQEVAESNDLDLDSANGLKQATALFAQEYPDLVLKKKDVGAPSGMGGNQNPALKVLEGGAEDYFKLTREEKDSLAKSVAKQRKA